MLDLVTLWYALPLSLAVCWNKILNCFADEKAEMQIVCVLCPGHTLLTRTENLQFGFLRLQSQCASIIPPPLADMGNEYFTVESPCFFLKLIFKVVYHFSKGVISQVSLMSSFLIYQSVCFFVCSNSLMELLYKTTVVPHLPLLIFFSSWNLSVSVRPTATHPWCSSSVWLSSTSGCKSTPTPLGGSFLCCICAFRLAFTFYTVITSLRSYLPLHRM